MKTVRPMTLHHNVVNRHMICFKAACGRTRQYEIQLDETDYVNMFATLGIDKDKQERRIHTLVEETVKFVDVHVYEDPSR